MAQEDYLGLESTDQAMSLWIIFRKALGKRVGEGSIKEHDEICEPNSITAKPTFLHLHSGSKILTPSYGSGDSSAEVGIKVCSRQVKPKSLGFSKGGMRFDIVTQWVRAGCSSSPT